MTKLHGKHIILNGERYMTRYFLFGGSTGEGWSLYLHRIHRADSDRRHHNHPWPWFFSIVLSGWYVEHRLSRERMESYAGPFWAWMLTRKKRQWFNYVQSPRIFHRIVQVSKRPVWTLVLCPPRDKLRSWGYINEESGEFSAYKHEPSTAEHF